MQGPAEQLSVRRAWPALAGLLLVALVGAAACQVPSSSSAKPGPTTSSSPAAVAVEWADKLCGVILEYDSVPVKLEVNATSPDAAVESLKQSLGTMSGRTNDSLTKLREVGPAPVAGGDEAAQSLISLLDTRKQIVDRSLESLGKINLSDRTAATGALQQVASDLQSLKTPVNPLEGMGTRFPALQSAARSADNCTEISRVRASRSALPPTPSYPDEFPTSPSYPSQTPPPSGSGYPTPPPDPTTYPTF
jgi:hypothetical protein